MLIQRRSPQLTSSTRGSVVSRRAESTRARAERLRRGFGRLGIRSEGVVQHVHCPDSTRGALAGAPERQPPAPGAPLPAVRTLRRSDRAPAPDHRRRRDQRILGAARLGRFPIEPHFLLPAWHWLPESARVAVLRRRAVGWAGRCPDPDFARRIVEEHRLMCRRELARLFPDAEIVAERFLGLVKSWTAIGTLD